MLAPRWSRPVISSVFLSWKPRRSTSTNLCPQFFGYGRLVAALVAAPRFRGVPSRDGRRESQEAKSGGSDFDHDVECAEVN